MSEKINTAKTTAPQQAKKTSAATRAITKKAPAVAAAAKKPKILTAGAVQEKKAKKIKPNKTKLVRDNFSMPQSDYAKIDELKQLCLKSGMQVKKNQLLRAGLNALGKLSAAQLKIALSSLDKASE